jgi:hypothetical protein
MMGLIQNKFPITLNRVNSNATMHIMMIGNEAEEAGLPTYELSFFL